MTTLRINDQFTSKKQPTDPLKVLPPELVGDIFHLWLLDRLYPLPQYSDSQLPALLCRVSKSWRDFVHTSPALWAHVIIETSQGTVASLHVLRKRLERSQSAPLFMHIAVGTRPDVNVLKVLFAECSRFHSLTLSVVDLSWWRDTMVGFTQLRKLTVRTWPKPGVPIHEHNLSAIFSPAPCLRCVEWQSTADPRPVEVIGHQLYSLDLAVSTIPITRVLELLAVCPNLRNAAITFNVTDEQTPMPLRERLLLRELRSLYLRGSMHLTCLLESVQAPLLSRLVMHWRQYNDPARGLEALESLLVYSPHLESIALDNFLKTEDGLISIIINNNNLVRLSVTAGSGKLITQRTLKLLTRRDQGNQPLPRLEELVLRGGVSVPDEVLLRMIESRTSPPDDVSRSRRACTLKSIRLHRWKPMAAGTVSRVNAICEERGLKFTGMVSPCDEDD